MTHVIPLTSRRAGTLTAAAAVPSLSIDLNASHVIERQAAIENALSMALYFVRQPGDSTANLWAATARTNRALAMLKQASATFSYPAGRK